MQLITIMGQTSSGKTQFSLNLAKEFQSRNLRVAIIGTDSRQIYKRLNIGSAKINGSWVSYSENIQTFLYDKIPHFLIDKIDLNTQYTLTDYLKDFISTVDILKFEKRKPDIIILCGGTGLYARAVNEEYQPTIILDEYQNEWQEYKNYLNTLETYKLIRLFNNDDNQDLKEVYKSLNNSEQNNPRRLINHLVNYKAKINNWLGPKLEYPEFTIKQKLAIKITPEKLKENLIESVQNRIQNGLIQEIQKLEKMYGNDRLLELGLEYGLGAQMIQQGWTFDKYAEELIRETVQYQKRQLIWLKTEPNVKWIEL